MEDKESDIRGWYEYGFFHLRVNTAADIFDLNRSYGSMDLHTVQVFSTFLHEYVHFLQEVTTTAGGYMVGLNIDFIKDVAYQVRHDGQPTFNVPFKFSNAFNVKTNKRLIEIYRGDIKDVDYALYDYYQVHPIELEDRRGRKLRPGKYSVYYHNKNGSRGKFHFGFICIKEFITHTLQKKLLPEIEHGDIPYTIVGQIIGKECPSFGDDPMNAVALCDACLMDVHPARLFFNSIERIRASGFKPLSNEEVYDFVYKDLKFTDHDREYTIEQAFDRGNDFTKRQIANALKSSIFLPNKKWLQYIMRQARHIRLKQPAFITELVEGPGRLSPIFFKIFRRLGTPFLSDSAFNGGFVPPVSKSFKGVQAYQLLAFREILKVFAGATRCDLYHFCKSRVDKDITNEHCMSAPWLRGMDDDLCPFGQLWKVWGLNGEVPVKGI